MITCRFRISIVVLTVLFVVEGKEKCEKCLPAEQCHFYGNLNAEQQERWIDRFVCPKPEKEYSDQLYGFASRAKGDVICCPDNIWGLNGRRRAYGNQNDDNLKYNTPSDTYPQIKSKNNFDGRTYDNNRPIDNNYNSPEYGNIDQGLNSYNRDVNLEPQRWNPRPSTRQGLNRGLGRSQNQGFDRNFNGGFNGNLYQSVNGNNQDFNRNQRFNRNEDPYFNRGNENVGATNQGGQCPLSSFPPNPETGCCGQEATNGNQISVPSRPNWMPRPRSNSRLTQAPSEWDSLWNPMGDFQNFMPFKDKRQIQETKVNVTIGNRIAGGKETELEQFPWTVLLKTTFDYGTRQSSFNCGGSVISSRYILTAAHCVVEENAVVKEVEVHLSEYDKRTFPRDCKNILGVGQKCIENLIMYAEEVIPHPKYDDNRLYNDIALIRLRGAAPYTDYIRPICLPPINIDNPDLFNLRLAVAGWGRNGQYKSDIKQSTVVNLVPNSECKEFYPSLTKAHLCAAGYSGEDTCKGDSGGPLMILYEGKYYVSGVVSGKRADAPCGTSVPSLYTNVYQFLPWIRSKIRA